MKAWRLEKLGGQLRIYSIKVGKDDWQTVLHPRFVSGLQLKMERLRRFLMMEDKCYQVN
jgi:hypothetical protein